MYFSGWYEMTIYIWVLILEVELNKMQLCIFVNIKNIYHGHPVICLLNKTKL